MKDASENADITRARKKDRRSLCTEGAIRDALLHEISDASYANASISSICRRAGTTRPTFYLHYDNLSDVLDELIEDVATEIGDVPMEICDECGTAGIAGLRQAGTKPSESKKPFCQIVLGEGKYAPLFRDDYIAGRVVERIIANSFKASMEAGASPEDANKMRILNLFRMNGCMAVAKTFMRYDKDWNEAMPIIDKFVASGLSAVFDVTQECDTRTGVASRLDVT